LALSVVVGGIFFSASDANSSETTIRIRTDRARIVPLVSTPATVIVGNPAVADVNIQNGNLLVIMGRNYGSTNIIALNAAGDQIAQFELSVTTGETNELSLYRGSLKATYSCAPRCEPELNASDGGPAFKAAQEQQTGKMGVVNGVVGGSQSSE